MSAGSRWHEVAGAITAVAGPTGAEGAGSYRLVLPVGETECGLAYPRWIHPFTRIPGGVDGGNGRYGVGDAVSKGFKTYVPVGDPVEAGVVLRGPQLLGTPDPTTGGPSIVGLFAATDGTAGGDGSIGDPWDIDTALDPSSGIGPGETLYVRGGTYSAMVRSNLVGASGNPVKIRNYPGEHVIFAGGYEAYGSWTWLWGRGFGIEIKAGNALAFNNRGRGNDLIGCIVHDAGHSGITSWGEAPDSRVLDCLSYNNGTMAAPNEAGNKDHGEYLENQTGTKLIDNNIVFNNGAYGLHLYAGAADQYVKFIAVTRTASIDNGFLARRPDFFTGTEITQMDGLSFDQCLSYRLNRAEQTVDFGYAGGPRHGSLAVRDCLFLGTASIPSSKWTSIVQTNTRIIGAAEAVPDEVFVFPSLVQPKYGHVHIYNGALVATVDVDLSTILAVGDAYDIYSAFDPLGSAIASGTYAGGSVAIPMDPIVTPTIAAGGAEITLGDEFGSFMVVGPDVDSVGVAEPDFGQQRAPIVEIQIDCETQEYVVLSRTDPDAYPDQDPDPAPTEHLRRTITPGVWTAWKMEWHLALDGSGSLRLWVADGDDPYGSPAVDYTGAIGYNQAYPAFWRMGLDVAEGTPAADHTLLYDIPRIRFAAGATDLVDPRGLPPGTGGGDGGPPPEPIIGGRPYGVSGLSASGGGPWNSTVLQLTRDNAANTLATLRAHGLSMFATGLGAGGEKESWGRPYDYGRWTAKIDEVRDNAAIAAAIADGTYFGTYLDEPFHPTRYGPAGISKANINKMLDYNWSIWPTVRQYIRVEPTRLDGVNCTGGWLAMKGFGPRGDTVPYFNQQLTKARQLGIHMVVGFNAPHYHGGNSSSENGPAYWITPAEYRSVGTILANGDPGVIDGFSSWIYGTSAFAQPLSAWYNDQPGMAQAVLDVRAVFAALDP